MHWFLSSRAANGHWNAAHRTENLFIQTFCLHGGLQSVASLYTWRLNAVDWTDGFMRKPGLTSEQRRHLKFSHWILDESVRRLIKVASQSCVTLGRLAPFLYLQPFCKKFSGQDSPEVIAEFFIVLWWTAARSHSSQSCFVAVATITQQPHLWTDVKFKPKRQTKLITLSLKTTY